MVWNSFLWGKVGVTYVFSCAKRKRKRKDSLSAESWIPTCKINLKEYGLPKKIMSHTDAKFVLNTFRIFCRNLNIHQTVLSSYHQHYNEAWIKLFKCLLKKCSNTNADIILALFQRRSTPPVTELPSPVTLIFNYRLRDYASDEQVIEKWWQIWGISGRAVILSNILCLFPQVTCSGSMRR